MTIVWFILAAVAVLWIGRLTAKQRGVIVLLAGASLASFQARVKANLAEGRRTFEVRHKAEIRALTLTPAELADIKPRKR